MPIILIIISFFLEGMITNLISLDSLFLPLFTLTSMVILYPFFNREKFYNYIITCFIIGAIYDIAYTNSLFINTFSFSLISVLIILIDHYIDSNIFSRSGINIVSIVLYRIITYFLLILFNYLSFNGNILIRGIYSSIIINFIYGMFLYFIANYINNKLILKKKIKSKI